MDDITQKILKDPFIRFLGISVDTIEKGYSRCSVVIRDEMLNFNGAVHGGLIFSLADVAFSIASNSDHLPSFALDVSGSFLKTPQVGDKVVAEAKMIHTTKRTGLYRMEVFKGNELIATFNGTVFRKV
ncbi:MAG: hotdog fold thioesterase [Desulfomonilia bacterium]|jgi:acyl-CoA thioesterase